MNYKHSAFYYGHVVDRNNCYINFSEGGLELTAILGLGAYTLTGLCNEIARAMTWAGTRAYDCTANRATRIITISCLSNFQLLFGSGTNSGASSADLIGFNQVNTSSGLAFSGALPSGRAFFPQSPINKYTPFKHWKGASDAAVNVSAMGRATVVSFGQVQRMRCNIAAITNHPMNDGSIIENNANAIDEALEFLEYLTLKNPIEFMFDRSLPGEFDSCILESTKDSSIGVSFELYEGLGKGLRGIYETDILTFRKLD
jgi:hypothetical protein